MTSGGSPPGLGGGSGGGFGGVGQAAVNFQEMVKFMRRLKDIENNVNTDSVNMGKYVKEWSKVYWGMFRKTGAMLEQELLRFINMFAAIGVNLSEGRATKHTRGIMEHTVITNLRCVNGDTSLFRQWRQRFIAALGQHDDHVQGEIVQHLVKKTDLGKEVDKVVEEVKTTCGGTFVRVSGDVWNMLLDKAEIEAYDKIKIVHKGEGGHIDWRLVPFAH